MINQPELNVGARLRALRESQNLSLRALAQRCGLSINAISQIERGENSPTVSSLQALASALGVPIADLFKDQKQATVIFIHPNDRLRSEARGVSMESLGIGLPNQQIEPFIVTVGPGVDNSNQPIIHHGEELIYVMEGEIEYGVADERYQMQSGDSLIFDATQPHYFHNHSSQPAKLLMVFLAGGHRYLAHRLHSEMTKSNA